MCEREGRLSLLRSCACGAIASMSKGGPNKKVGGMTFTKQVPNFLRVMGQQDESGIDGAVRRHAERENVEREDRDDEAPIVVDASLALTSKERKKLEDRGVASSSGSLRFKGDDNSASSRFQESAFDVAARAEQEEAERARRQEEAEAEAASGKRPVFSSSAAHKAKKEKKRAAEGAAVAAVAKIKKVKNKNLLSFEEEDG